MAEELHPLVEYGIKRGLSRIQTAAVFGIEYGTFRQLVSGHTGASWKRAAEWEASSRDMVKATDVMRWQQRNRKPAAGEAA